MSVSIYSTTTIPFKEINNTYKIKKVNDKYWIDTSDGGSINVNVEDNNIDSFTVFYGGGTSESYKLLSELREKYNMLNEDEFQKYCFYSN